VEVTRGCGRGCRFCAPTQIPFRSFPVDHILREIRLNRRAGITQVSLHSDDALRYGSKSLRPNREALLGLLEAVREETGGHRFGFDFFSVASIMQDPGLLEEVAEVMGLGGSRYSTIEVGVETGSPRLLRLHMAGKARPFPVGRWPELVVEAAGLLHDLHWIVCYSIILGLPGETSKDVALTMELVEQLKGYNCVVIPIIFMPAAGFRRSPSFGYEDMTEEHWELFLSCVELITKNASLFLTHSLPPTLRRLAEGAIRMALNPVRRRIRLWRWRRRSQDKGWA